MSTLTPESSLGSYVKISRPLPKQKMREIVLQILYALGMDPTSEESLVPLLMSETAVTQKHASSALSFSKEILAKSPELDLLIAQTVKNASFEKLTLMEKNVLRLTLFEHFHGQSINTAILIAEATRLVKKFGYIEACTFIHAVLNDIFRLPIPETHPETSLVCC
ncbi:N utilization substance protein B homolog,transcription antitermination protein NusB,transcription antitermination factor NusB,NusB family [Chlamydia poikilotherma]|uniref:N utilization substance protein B homolog,transcription antitermination protein NusB,transcription antitermination factor NusB,NusB family n=1 Tax=Chlamydia poikilotherma TaxID=1967783 RepID=A0A3B0Q8N2_9CHLA|nr:transcription antitermination factor NusB [Chlamydia poikilotherma]SYX09237.1 N utilization substance protein B homolog,transcription antitermination protein NusB,transcription antitermination factor NusB,NusB family [Chlamydia poikilotherma]